MSDIPIEIILLSCQGPITADGAANKKRRQAKIEIMQIHCQQTSCETSYQQCQIPLPLS